MASRCIDGHFGYGGPDRHHVPTHQLGHASARSNQALGGGHRGIAKRCHGSDGIGTRFVRVEAVSAGAHV